MIPKLNQIYAGDCVEAMRLWPSEFVDLVVTSPPYGSLRTYNGFKFDAAATISELYRITKPGGVLVWIVADETKNGRESMDSFKQAISAGDSGWWLHDTMIYLKNQLAFPDSTRYYNAFEYMFVFSKGKPKTFNPIKDRKNSSHGRVVAGKQRKRDGGFEPMPCSGKSRKEFGVRWNYWLAYNQSRGLATRHPAVFPDSIASDHIISWSNNGDIILDPFMGSGTTAVCSERLGRRWIGCEVSGEYISIALARLASLRTPAKPKDEAAVDADPYCVPGSDGVISYPTCAKAEDEAAGKCSNYNHRHERDGRCPGCPPEDKKAGRVG